MKEGESPLLKNPLMEKIRSEISPENKAEIDKHFDFLKEMKPLQQIKDEIAREKGFDSFDNFMSYWDYEDLAEIESVLNEISKRYAEQAIDEVVVRSLHEPDKSLSEVAKEVTEQLT